MTTEIMYKDYVNEKMHIDYKFRTVKNTYNAETKTVKIYVDDFYAQRIVFMYDDEAIRSLKADITDEEIESMRANAWVWFEKSEGLNREAVEVLYNALKK